MGTARGWPSEGSSHCSTCSLGGPSSPLTSKGNERHLDTLFLSFQAEPRLPLSAHRGEERGPRGLSQLQAGAGVEGT